MKTFMCLAGMKKHFFLKKSTSGVENEQREKKLCISIYDFYKLFNFF